MTASLRPMTLGEILDRAIQIYRSRFAMLAGIAAIPTVFLLLLEFFNEFWWRIPVPRLGILFGVLNLGLVFYLLGYFHISSIAQYLLWPAMIDLSSDEALGKRSTFRGSVRTCAKRGWAHFGLGLLLILIVLVIPEVVSTLLSAIAAMMQEEVFHIDTSQFGSFSITMTASILFGTVAYFWLCSRMLLSWPVQVRERVSIRGSIRRGWSLSRGAWRRVFAAQLFAVIAWWALNFLAAATLRSVFLALRHSVLPHLSVRVLIVVLHLGRSTVDLLIWPILPIALSVIYYDQRIRQEGFDIEMMMQAAGMNGSEPSTPVVLPFAAVDSGEQLS